MPPPGAAWTTPLPIFFHAPPYIHSWRTMNIIHESSRAWIQDHSELIGRRKSITTTLQCWSKTRDKYIRSVREELIRFATEMKLNVVKLIVGALIVISVFTYISFIYWEKSRPTYKATYTECIFCRNVTAYWQLKSLHHLPRDLSNWERKCFDMYYCCFVHFDDDGCLLLLRLPSQSAFHIDSAKIWCSLQGADLGGGDS